MQGFVKQWFEDRIAFSTGYAVCEAIYGRTVSQLDIDTEYTLALCYSV